MSEFPHNGRIESISVRPVRRQMPVPVDQVNVIADQGLEGDHYAKAGGNRQVTLIQAEHLEAVAHFLQQDQIDPLLTRRNIVVSGINLQALKDRKFRLGKEVILEGTGDCHPCSRMEENFGFGGLNAMRGHGGITARVIKGGFIQIGDALVDLAKE